jgi:hypothetical protein
VASVNGRLQFLQLGPELVAIHLVDKPPLLILPVPLDRGNMICHTYPFRIDESTNRRIDESTNRR